MSVDQISADAVEIKIHRLGTPEGTFTADSLHGRAVPPRRWHVPQTVPSEQVTLFTGDGGVGKSTLALQLCCATVLATDWIGQTPRQGRALYISAEDGRDEVHRRLDALSVFYGEPLSKFSGLTVWPLADHGDAALVIADGTDTVKPTLLWEKLVAYARMLRPALIVIDASADAFGGNEIVRGHVRKFIALLRTLAMEIDAAIVLLAHPSVSGMSSGTGISGSTAWNNSVRSRLYLTRPNTEPGMDADPDRRVLTLMKANYAQAGAELQLRLAGGGFKSDSDRGPGALDMSIAKDRIDAQFLAFVSSYEAQQRPVSDRPSSTYAPVLFAKDPCANGTSKKGFEAAMGRLLHDNRIRIVETGPASRVRRRLVVGDSDR